MRSKPWISCWLSGWPTPGNLRSAANATGVATIRSGTRTLNEHGIGDAPVAVDLPRLNGVEVDGARLVLLLPVFERRIPMGAQFRQRRLNVVGFVGAARL